MPKAMNTGKLRLYLNNSTELFDGQATIADTEMLTDLLDGSSFPRRRQPLSNGGDDPEGESDA